MYTINANGKIDMKQIRKGSRITLKNGWTADVEDNYVNRNTRLCTVYGFETEMGSVYARDICTVYVDGKFIAVEPTKAQKRSAWMESTARRACDPTSEAYWSA